MDVTRKIRFFYADPDATDSSSDELELTAEHRKSKRVVSEVILKPADELTNSRKTTAGKRQKKKYVGVRMRKWGKIAAEVRDPAMKKRVWVGTFITEEEAHAAILKKKAEIEERMKENSPDSVLAPAEDSGEKGAPAEDSGEKGAPAGGSGEKRAPAEDSGEWGALTEEFVYHPGMQIVDEEGFWLGDSGKIDDLRISATEDGVILP